MFIVYLILFKSCIHYMYMKDFDWLMKSPDIVVTKWYANKKVFRVQAKRPRRSQNCVNFYHVRIIVENLIWISIILQRKWNSALHCDVIDFWCLQNHCDWYIRFFLFFIFAVMKSVCYLIGMTNVSQGLLRFIYFLSKIIRDVCWQIMNVRFLDLLSWISNLFLLYFAV